MAGEIRAVMGRQKLSGRKLAEKVGRSPNWVSLKTSGAQRLTVDDLFEIAAALDVPITDLIPAGRKGVTGRYADPGNGVADPSIVARVFPSRTPLAAGMKRTAPTGR